VRDQLHVELVRLMNDLELQLVVAGQRFCRFLQREQLLGSDVFLVIGQRRHGVLRIYHIASPRLRGEDGFVVRPYIW
jgi:hypothetical protein